MTEKKNTKETPPQYWPVLVVLIVSALMANGLYYGGGAMEAMHYFMGSALCIFAVFKLIDISGFADQFAKYDLLAGKVRAYALAYPFIELGLGLAFLSFYMPVSTSVVTAVIMLFGALGVLNGLRGKKELSCACMGTGLNLPLTKISLGETVIMGGMALYMVFQLT